MHNTSLSLAFAVVSIGFAATATAQVQQIHPLHQVGDLLIGDSFTSKVLRARDVNNNGDYNDAGEVTLYFDPAIALDPNTNLPYGASKLGNPIGMVHDMRGNVYVVDSSTSRTCFRMRDLNGDGDANDPGESNIWMDGTNGGGLSNFAFQGVTVDAAGNVWLTASGQGTGFTNIDRIFKTTDTNNDGDANDVGEQTVVYDRGVALLNGAILLDVPAWPGFMTDGNLYVTNGFTSNQGTYRLVDLNANNRYDDAGEISSVYSGLAGNPVPKFNWCTRYGRDGRLYVFNQTDRLVIRATDVDNNFRFDDVGEAAVFCQSGTGGFTWSGAFSLETRPDGAILVGDQGGSPNNRVLLFRDLDNSGDALGTGEQTAVLTFATSAFPTAKPRSMLFLPVEPSQFGTGCPTSLNTTPTLEWVRDGGIAKFGTTQFTMKTTGNIPFAPIYLLYSDSTLALPFDNIVGALTNPGCTLYPNLFSIEFNGLDFGFCDATGELIFSTPISPSPSLGGMTFTAQVMTVDTLISGTPLLLSNALLVPIL